MANRKEQPEFQFMQGRKIHTIKEMADIDTRYIEGAMCPGGLRWGMLKGRQ
jgi:hypothetical protein